MKGSSHSRSPARDAGGPFAPFRVVVRCRGMHAAEVAPARMRYPARVDSSYCCAFTRGRHEVGMIDPDTTARLLPKHNLGTASKPFYSMDRRYTFDAVFDRDSDNHEVFEEAVLPLVEWVTAGFNATCFAYGATGSGKTFTMTGDRAHFGVIQYALSALFTSRDEGSSCGRSPSRSEAIDVVVTVSYVEIYNERIFDLLAIGKPAELDLKEDVSGVSVKGVNEVSVTSLSELNQLLEAGMKRRTKAATGGNAVSSRSHAVLQLVYQRIERDSEGGTSVTQGCLNLIDLAGSERESVASTASSRSSSASSFGSAVSSMRGKVGSLRRREGSNINRSLLALGNCITVLGQHASSVAASKLQGATALPPPHIPYRDSKLTRLLKDSLGGNTRTVMIATICPSCMAYDDTLSTLKYATRAKAITRSVKKNILTGSAANEAVRRLEELRAQKDRIQELGLNSVEEEVPTAPTSTVGSGEDEGGDVSERELSEAATHCEFGDTLPTKPSSPPPLASRSQPSSTEASLREERHSLYWSVKARLMELEKKVANEAVLTALLGPPAEHPSEPPSASVNQSTNSIVAEMMHAVAKPARAAPRGPVAVRSFFEVLADGESTTRTQPSGPPVPTASQVPTTPSVAPQVTTSAHRREPLRQLHGSAGTGMAPTHRIAKVNGGVASAAARHNLSMLNQGGCYEFPSLPCRHTDPTSINSDENTIPPSSKRTSVAILDDFLCGETPPLAAGHRQYSFRL